MTTLPPTIPELRAKVQTPVRMYNDVAGLLVGDHISIHVTRFFIAKRISPTVATLSMLVLGVTGSIMLVFGDVWAVVGLSCIFAYYICDCVDGEVARYHSQEKLIWGFHDYFFHLYVKSAFWSCMGIAAFRTVWETWILVPALSALVSTLLLKFLWDIPTVIAARYVVMRNPSEGSRFIPELVPGSDPGPETVEVPYSGDESLRLSHLGGPVGILRAIMTNFDLSILIFLLAAVLDLFIPAIRPPVAWMGEYWNLKVVLLCIYGVVLPFDFLDRMFTHIRRGSFYDEAGELLKRAHHFRIR